MDTKCDGQQSKELAEREGRFPVTMAAWTLIGYLLATVPQVIVDPILTTHVRYGPRTYPHCWWIAPIAIGVALGTYLSLRRVSKLSVICAPLPLVLAMLVSMPIFRPEVPHGNLLFVCLLWIMILTITVWVHDLPQPPLPEPASADAQMSIREYLKEYISLWKMALLGVFGAYLGLTVTMLTAFQKFNKTFVTDPGEIFHLNRLDNIEVLLLSLFILCGPLLETARRVLWGMESLRLTAENEAQGLSPNEGRYAGAEKRRNRKKRENRSRK